MPNGKQLPKDFLSVDEAVALINSDTRENPVVDTDYLMQHALWLEKSHNFNIPLLRRDNLGRVVKAGHRYVFVESDYDRTILEKAIVDKYRELASRDFDESRRVKNYSTVVTDGETGVNDNPSGRRMVDTSDRITRYGEPLRG